MSGLSHYRPRNPQGQLAAVRSAIDNTGKVILQDHMRHCMVDAVNAGDSGAIDELCQAIDKFMK